MKVMATCEACGASFNAPASLQGQVVKCPACGGNIQIPEAGGAAPTPATPGSGGAMGGSSITGGISGAPTSGGTAAGRSSSGMERPAIGLKSHLTTGGSDDEESDLDRVKKNKLFQAYAGIEEREERSFRFTLGLGIAAAVLLLAVGIGIYLVINNTRTVPVRDVAQPANGSAASSSPTPPASPALGGAGAPGVIGAHDGGDAGTGAVAASDLRPAPPDRDQVVGTARWVERSPLGRSPTSARVQIESHWDPQTGQHTFHARITPDASGLNMASRIILFRSSSPEGPFTQADLSKPSGLDPSGALIYSVFDAQAATLGGNRVFYRVSAEDSEGRRLFDSQPAEHPVIPPFQVENGRLRWAPLSDSGPTPSLRVVVTIAAAGWEDAVVAQVTPQGPVDVALPGAEAGLPLRVVVRASYPAELDTSSKEPGPWQIIARRYTIGESSDAASSVAGLLPVWSGDRLSYRAIPDASTFSDLQEAAGAGGGTAVSFQPAASGPRQVLQLPPVPTPRRVLVTPFEHSIRVSWDNTELLAGLDRLEDPDEVAVTVFRSTPSGGRTVAAMLPPATTSFTDSEVTLGVPVSYEVRLTARHDADIRPMVKAEAYLLSRGTMPVLVEAAPGRTAEPVAAEAGLTRLQVAFTSAELYYPYTDRAALAVRQAIREAVSEDPAVSILERDAAPLAATRVQYVGAPATGPTESSAVRGAPAHMQFRLLDAKDPAGTRIQLWCTDLLSGQTWMLAEAPSEAVHDSASAAPLVEPVLELLAACRPERSPAEEEAAPSKIVFGPLLPLDAPRRFFGMDNLAQALIAAGHEAGAPILPAAHVHTLGVGDPLAAPGTIILAGRAWNNEGIKPGMLVAAVDGVTARLIATFHADEVDRKTYEAFGRWCAQLRVPASSATSPAAHGSSSVLLDREATIPPLHPGHAATADFQASGTLDMRPQPPVAGNVATFAFGLPLPEVLSSPPGVIRRSANDPLSVIRPFILQPEPMKFETWVAAYARYLEADFESYREGIDVVNATLRERGPVTPRFLVRGQEAPMAIGPLPARALSAPHADALNLQGLFPASHAGGALVDYRSELDVYFRRRPYACYHAWKAVPRQLGEPFLKTMVQGVQGGQFGRLDFNFVLPPEFAQFLAAKALDERSLPTIANWRKKAVEVSAGHLDDLLIRPGIDLNDYQKSHIANALLILLEENHPKVLATMRNPAMLIAYLHLAPEQAGDALRLLVDRLGPVAWQWAAAQNAIAWEHFLWGNEEEMQFVISVMPEKLPEPIVRAVGTWLESGAMATGTPAGPASTPTSPPVPAPHPEAEAAPTPGTAGGMLQSPARPLQPAFGG